MNNKCNVCEKVFGRIYELDRHKNRKIKCIPKHQDGLSYDIQIPSNPPVIPPINEISPPISSLIPPVNVIEVNHHNKCNICNKKYLFNNSGVKMVIYNCLQIVFL
jgi:hypothetical protein